MRTVIFVGSAPFSGSTLLEMVLANDPNGFACGEVYSLFHPTQARHVNPACGCGDEHCDIWKQVAKNGQDHLYETILELFPNVEIITDSSKNPFWIRSQSQALLKKGINVRNILVWKTPLEFAHSCKRRGVLTGWDKGWVNYHRLYLSLTPRWRAVPYRALTADGAIWQKVCGYLEIPYFPGKERYWEKTHHGLFGNYSAKFHLYSKEAAEDYLAGTFDQDRLQYYRTIYYREVDDPELPTIVDQTFSQSQYLERITRLLEQNDVVDGTMAAAETSALRFRAPAVELRRVKNLTKALVGRIRLGRQLSGLRTG